MKYPEKRVMYLAPEIPALSATFVYNEIFFFVEQICPVEAVSVHKPASPAGQDVYQKLGEHVYYLYEQSLRARILSTIRMFFRQPLPFMRAFFSLISDAISLGSKFRTAAGLFYRFFYSAVLAEKMLKSNIDHLHVHFAHVPGDIAMYASMMTGIPFSLTGHANDIYERGWLLRQKTQRAVFFATISEFNKRALVAEGCDSEKIEIVRCGIDQQKFQFRGAERKSEGRLRIGSLGRLVPKKGFITLLESCAKLQDQNLPFILEIAGDGPLLMEIQSQIDVFGLSENVQLLGAMPHSQVSEWMRSLDVFALACCRDKNGDVDGIPVVLMEAMAIGVPVLTTSISGLPELVVHNETGLLSEPEDAETIASLLAKLESDTNLRCSLVGRAKSHVDNVFTIQANVEKLGRLIFLGKS